MDQKKVLIIEDEKSISDIIKFNLVKEGFAVETAYDGQDGYMKAISGSPDLILLDVMLPIMDGFSVCKKVRETSTVPILMVTAKEEEVDKVLGLELGADDYITKPFGMRELIARIKANIRRSEFMTDQADAPENVKEFGNLAIDLRAGPHVFLQTGLPGKHDQRANFFMAQNFASHHCLRNHHIQFLIIPDCLCKPT
jgi:two-component system response regulator VicR